VSITGNIEPGQEVSLAHLVREVDVQPSHPGSSLQRHEFGFLFQKTKRCRGFPYRISFQKTKYWARPPSLSLHFFNSFRNFLEGFGLVYLILHGFFVRLLWGFLCFLSGF
jgi:hypothetical protein